MQHNPQALGVIEYCSISALVDGIAANEGQLISAEDIPSLPGGEEPHIVDVPLDIEDPDGGSVNTTLDGQYSSGQLILQTSREPMQYVLRYRHTIICNSSRKGLVGVFAVEDLVGRYGEHIYGELRLDALEEYETNFRSKPNESPLTRAVEHWLKNQIVNYAKLFQQQEDERHNQKERNELQRLNEEMNQFLHHFLDESQTESGGENSGGIIQGNIVEQGRASLPMGILVAIEHNLSDQQNVCGENIVLYVRLRFLDNNGKRIRPVPVHWESSNSSVAFAQLGSIVTGSPGTCQVYAVAENGVRSAPIDIKVIHVDSITIQSPDDNSLPLGSRKTIGVWVTSGDHTYQNVKLEWHSSDEENVKVGTNAGIVTSTSGPGTSEIWAESLNIQSNRILINTLGQCSDTKFPRYPEVLLSEINEDPDTGSLRRIDPEAGTVVQDIADRQRNIYWVNMRSPIAHRFFESADGLSYLSQEFRVYLAERYAEVVFLNKMKQSDQLEPADVIELMRDQPTKLRQSLANNFEAWLSGEWHST